MSNEVKRSVCLNNNNNKNRGGKACQIRFTITDVITSTFQYDFFQILPFVTRNPCWVVTWLVSSVSFLSFMSFCSFLWIASSISFLYCSLLIFINPIFY